jgi:NTP pyrophosphatase (non-canonical NTP hydrolase)
MRHAPHAEWTRLRILAGTFRLLLAAGPRAWLPAPVPADGENVRCNAGKMRFQDGEELVWDEVGRLHAYHGDVPVEIRLLKLTEEVGETADAFLGVHGLNSRKGVCRSRDDLLDELADVIITAAVAMSGVTGDAEEARSHLERRLATVTARAGL